MSLDFRESAGQEESKGDGGARHGERQSVEACKHRKHTLHTIPGWSAELAELAELGNMAL